MTKLRPGDRAWIALGLGIATYELLCPDTELMSEAADRYMLRHPWLVRSVAVLLAGHVCNMLPDRCDPLHYLFRVKRYITHLD